MASTTYCRMVGAIFRSPICPPSPGTVPFLHMLNPKKGQLSAPNTKCGTTVGARFPYNAVSERTADRGKGGITDGKQDDLSRIGGSGLSGRLHRQGGGRISESPGRDEGALPLRARGIPGKEGDKGNIHILLQYPPGDSIRPIVSILKQERTYHIWRTHHHKMLAQHDWAERPLWSDGSFAASVGDASAETIRQYIASQG